MLYPNRGFTCFTLKVVVGLCGTAYTSYCNRLGHFTKDCRAGPRVANPLNVRNLIVARRACFECGGTDHYKVACPRLIKAPGQEDNRPNQALVIDGGSRLWEQWQPSMRRAFMSRKSSPGPKHYDGHKAELVYHEKVVRILLPHGEALIILGKRPKEKVSHLMSAKAKEQKLKNITVV
nr:zinc finger, CCHC-type [Tanacetum cinerariifolium]